MTEKDPHGKDPHTPGAKLDQGKLRAGLMHEDFAHALHEVARVTTFGARKYTDHGWRSVPNGPDRYHDALHRHLDASLCGEEFDQDSGLSHLAHAAWNLLALIELAHDEDVRERSTS